MRLLIIAFILGAVLSCNGDDDDNLDCSTVLCAGRPELAVQFVDATTSEQLLMAAQGEFPEGLTVYRDGQSMPLEAGQGYGFISGRILVYQFPDTTRIVLENSFDVTITGDVVEISDSGCCPIYEVNNITTTQGTLEILDGETSFKISL